MLCMSCQYLPIDSPKKIDKEKLVNTELMIIKNYLDKGEPRLAWEQLRQLSPLSNGPMRQILLMS